MARPRRVGTAANDAVIADLAGRLKSFGCSVEVRPFEFSPRGERAVAVYVLAAQILVIITFWMWGFSAWAATVPALLLAALILAGGQLFRAAARSSLWPAGAAPHPWGRLAGSQRCRTTNIVARLPSRPGSGAGPGLLLVAHSDSKSQPLPLPARAALVAIASLAALVFAVLTVLRVVFPAATSGAALAGLIGMLAGVPLMLLYLAGSGNASPGAVDNASGAGLLLHLAECLCDQPPACVVTFLITGAEEMGVLGALAFVRDAGREALENTRVLNFDGIGTAGRLAIVGRTGDGLGRTVREACNELGVPLAGLPVIGAQYDHLPFADLGLEAVTLVTTGRAALSVHTPQDDASQLDVDGFRRAGEVALRVLEKVS